MIRRDDKRRRRDTPAEHAGSRAGIGFPACSLALRLLGVTVAGQWAAESVGVGAWAHAGTVRAD